MRRSICPRCVNWRCPGREMGDEGAQRSRPGVPADAPGTGLQTAA
jgi:hypothetical protein